MSSSQNYVSQRVLLGVAYSMLGITTVVFLARALVRVRQPKRFVAEDFFLLLAYLFFLSLTIMYIVLAPTMFRVTDATTGKIPIYPTILADSLFMIKIFFANTMIFWFTLYSVKFAFLCLYRRLMMGIPMYLKLWWAAVGFCVLTLIGCVITNFTSCHSMHAWFTPGLCTEKRDVDAQIASLYYAYAVDVLSDLFIMFLPLRLIWKLQRPTAQKVGIGALFCVGLICIIFATIRVVQIGVKTQGHSTPSSSWLALWAIVESAVVIMVGCCPGLYSKAKEAHSSRKNTSKQSGMPPTYGYASHGYAKQGTAPGSTTMGTNNRDSRAANGDIEMGHLPTKVSAGGQTRRWKDKMSSVTDTFWANDSSSQEELNTNKQIYVSTSIEIKDEEEGDRAGSRREADYHYPKSPV
ncbi:uncharacterized protein Z520_06015 [Fonsecaea multimorphosa CBS 102226]|uniref:Rhodopsin domain-containing protein n=1 Tax=Fonsecaea multimorphosa CBS 102226 TaxID=1442371 RepID=A0A0D2JWN1_9EURO|nr:uncharacterized protein Z520_06015 [Fonsecaea multimorphosa CBS 102226]KIX97937.1 hypothetical protein Z520_06015 [Fonsecaea multimorphosa CBS 102226]OAL24310.1 hypothetical protein AYO22_05686 [Fonsecaea multimorphosa]